VLDAATGEILTETLEGTVGTDEMVLGDNILVVTDGVVLFNGNGQTPTDGESVKPRKSGLYLTALALDDGRRLWSRPGSRGVAGASTMSTDLSVAKGIVWCGSSLEGVDLHTGEVRKNLALSNLISPGHHYRCYHGWATENFLIWPKRGAEFIDLEGDDHMRNDWLRAPYFGGALPANGLLYVPSSQCFCYPGVLVSGFLAMSAETPDVLKPATDANIDRGDAFGQVSAAVATSSEDWLMYRHNGGRSGATKITLPTDLQQCWEADLACQGSQPVIVGDRLLVAEKETHRVRCFDTADGKDVWNFTAGGAVVVSRRRDPRLWARREDRQRTIPPRSRRTLARCEQGCRHTVRDGRCPARSARLRRQGSLHAADQVRRDTQPARNDAGELAG